MDTLRQSRKHLRLTQQQAAARLGVSQTYLSLLEKGRRPLTPKLARKAVHSMKASPLLLPVSGKDFRSGASPEELARELASLGYPGLSHLRKSCKRNPAEVLLRALAQDRLEARVAEALPWLPLRFPEMDLDWLVREAKLHNLTNRLGFVLSLVAETIMKSGSAPESTLARMEAALEQLARARLAEEQTLGEAELSDVEKTWLREHRSEAARYWNVLSDWRPEHLQYARYPE